MDALREVPEVRAGAVKLILDLGELCRRTFAKALAGQRQQPGDAGESQLCAPVQPPLQAAPLRVGGLDDPAA